MPAHVHVRALQQLARHKITMSSEYFETHCTIHLCCRKFMSLSRDALRHSHEGEKEKLQGQLKPDNNEASRTQESV